MTAWTGSALINKWLNLKDQNQPPNPAKPPTID